MKSEKISKSVIKFSGNTNSYLILNKLSNILIDTCISSELNDFEKEIIKYTKLDSIKTIILTHLHYDHIGGITLFENAGVFTNKIGVESNTDKKLKFDLILKEKEFKEMHLNLKLVYDEKVITDIFEIIETSGHSSANICIYFKEENVLFTGDTYFKEGLYGRTDLPTSNKIKQEESIKLIKKIIKEKNPIIAPGHDY